MQDRTRYHEGNDKIGNSENKPEPDAVTYHCNGCGGDFPIALPLIYGLGLLNKNEQLNATEEKARLDKARRINQELKNKLLKGELVSLEQINQESARNALAIRNRFLAMPSRLAQMLETTSTFKERFQLIDSEIRNALIALGDGAET